MGPNPHAAVGDDLPDPWEGPGDTLPGDRNDSDELISRLAGDDVERLMGGRPVGRAGPVEELTSQLDDFFEQLRQKQSETMQALARTEQQSGGLIINEAERQALVCDLGMDALDESDPVPMAGLSPHRMFLDPDPAPVWYLKPLDLCGGMIESLSPAVRILVNIAAVVSFLAAGAALVYVIILRQG